MKVTEITTEHFMTYDVHIEAWFFPFFVSYQNTTPDGQTAYPYSAYGLGTTMDAAGSLYTAYYFESSTVTMVSNLQQMIYDRFILILFYPLIVIGELCHHK